MSYSETDHGGGIGRGCWRGFAEVLEEDAVPENQRPYYCRWVQGLFAAVGNGGLNAHAVEAHIKELASGGINGWQFRQAVEAMRLALCRVGRDHWGSWAQGLDWQGWRELGRELERGHPTRRRAELKTDAWRALEEKFGTRHPDEDRALGAIERMVRETARARD